MWDYLQGGRGKLGRTPKRGRKLEATFSPKKVPPLTSVEGGNCGKTGGKNLVRGRPPTKNEGIEERWKMMPSVARADAEARHKGDRWYGGGGAKTPSPDPDVECRALTVTG